MQRIISEIEILEEEYAGQAPMNVLVSNMSDKYDMSEEKVDEMVKKLKTQRSNLRTNKRLSQKSITFFFILYFLIK